VRLEDDIHFRLMGSREQVQVWVPRLAAFRSLDWGWLRLVASLAKGVAVGQAAGLAGLPHEGQAEAAISTLIDYGVLVEAEARPPRGARAARV
jgi:hypothetical protein